VTSTWQPASDVWHAVANGAVLFVMLTWITTSDLRGEETPEIPKIAATVNGSPICRRQLDHYLQQLLGETDVPAERGRELRRAALDQLVKRQLVLAFLRREGMAASQNDVDFALAQLESRLARQSQSLDDWLQESGLDRQSLDSNLTWEISWRRYLRKQVTDDRLQRYFEGHRVLFDGTKLRVAHLLLKLPEDPDELNQVRQRAREIRQRIAAGEVSFEQAVRKFSQGPSGQAGGDLGEISHDGPMPATFTRAAFRLEPGEISPPVVSRFGVHLIQCREKIPGNLPWQQARQQLIDAVAHDLFEAAAAEMQSDAQIQLEDWES
jgi:parvulin-like peptidyl-prolyl isomerase